MAGGIGQDGIVGGTLLWLGRRSGDRAPPTFSTFSSQENSEWRCDLPFCGALAQGDHGGPSGTDDAVAPEAGSVYPDAMPFEQCQAVIFHERTSCGRGALSPPRRCRKVALEGQLLCEIHLKQADLQDLYRRLLGAGWHFAVERWERERRGVK